MPPSNKIIATKYPNPNRTYNYDLTNIDKNHVHNMKMIIQEGPHIQKPRQNHTNPDYNIICSTTQYFRHTQRRPKNNVTPLNPKHDNNIKMAARTRELQTSQQTKNESTKNKNEIQNKPGNKLETNKN